MIMNQQVYRALGIAIPIITGLTLLGITKSVFQIGIGTNLFSTGIILGTVLGIAQILLAIGIWKNRI
jgi:hypothetical protein